MSTFVPTSEGWLYLAVLLDLFSRRVVGWATSDSNDRALARVALGQALRERRPPTELVHHTDRGTLRWRARCGLRDEKTGFKFVEICPMTISEARAYVNEHHRDHPAPRSGLSRSAP